MVLALQVLFVCCFGAVGVALGIVIPQFVGHGIVLPVFASRTLEYPHGRYFTRAVFPAILSALPALALAIWIVRVFPAEQLGIVVGQMCLVGMVAVTSAFIVCLDSSTRSTALRAALPRGWRSRPAVPAVGQTTDQS